MTRPPARDYPRGRALAAAQKPTTRKKRATTVELAEPTPHVFERRPYQQALWDAWDAGTRRFLEIWHRRAGKDRTGQEFIRDRSQERPANYWHMFPLYAQARRAIWNGINPHTGKPILEETFPLHERAATDNVNMRIELEWGATYQLLGSDKFDHLVGSPPAGVVFSEWALCNPAAWSYIRPILVENDGWAMFITTYRGRNHAYQMVQKLKDNPRWHVSVLTVDDTTRVDGSPVITPEDVQREREEGMTERMIRQEFYCDPMAALAGSIYGASMNEIFEMGRAA